MKTNDLPKEIYNAALQFNLLSTKINFYCKKITDGVSSDIWYVRTEKNKEFCIKRALGKLTVKEDWFAPVDRSNFEAMYFNYCKKICPNYFPKILGHDNKNYILAMRWYEPKYFVVWKKKLLTQNVNNVDSLNVSNILLKKHKYFFKKKYYQKKFNNDQTFHAIRIEPYIIFTSKKYPEYKSNFLDVAQSLIENKKTLIHGDFSPKNILIGPENPIILDAETACWGDPVFDLAFCNNHLLLKSLMRNSSSKKFLNSSYKFLKNYVDFINWEEKEIFVKRLINILPLLLLARIDGKSPVDYLGFKEKEKTRTLAINLLKTKTKNLEHLYELINNYVKK